jgi:hypothetical protein
MILNFQDHICVGASDGIRVYRQDVSGDYELKVHKKLSLHDSAAQAVRTLCWGILPYEDGPFDPLVLCATGSTMHILDMRKRAIVGVMRGHGGVGASSIQGVRAR